MAILLNVVLFILGGLLFMLVVQFYRSSVVNAKNISIKINGKTNEWIYAASGEKLINAMHNNGFLIPSACGGFGSCGLCRVKISVGTERVSTTEFSQLTSEDISSGYRLACQVVLERDLEIDKPEGLDFVKKITCEVISNCNKSNLIKELKLKIPDNISLSYQAGGYIQLECPPHHVNFSDFEIDSQYVEYWVFEGLYRYQSNVNKSLIRAYSIATYPDEKGFIMLNVRLAIPPSNNPNVPPGAVSAYLWSLHRGDLLTIIGPYGSFFAKESTDEMVFIGGGAGMASMRSLIFDQLKRIHSNNKISFWYGARSLSELFYIDEFEELTKIYPNFTFEIALSDPKPEDHWKGYTGYIHDVLLDNYLKNHSEVLSCDFYICGPPLMNAAVTKVLINLGVSKEKIMSDVY